MALFQRLNRTGLTIVLVTHEPDIASYAQRIVAFRDGMLVGDERRWPRRRARPCRGRERGVKMLGHGPKIGGCARCARNKLRSALTMLGIIIGVGAVIAMMASGPARRPASRSRSRASGSNLIIVLPGIASPPAASGSARAACSRSPRTTPQAIQRDVPGASRPRRPRCAAACRSSPATTTGHRAPGRDAGLLRGARLGRRSRAGFFTPRTCDARGQGGRCSARPSPTNLFGDTTRSARRPDQEGPVHGRRRAGQGAEHAGARTRTTSS